MDNEVAALTTWLLADEWKGLAEAEAVAGFFHCSPSGSRTTVT